MATDKKKVTKVTKTEEKKKETKVSKPAVKETVKAEVVAEKSAKKVEAKTSSLTIDVLDLEGKVTGKVSLPIEIFGETVNKTLLAQAVRVYLANKRQGNASTKTRGEVDGSTRKIYRQKGTGKARHGSVRAPIFVKGGIVFGPKPRDFSLDLPKKMRRKALFSALSAKVVAGEVKVLAGLEGIEAKTKKFVTTMANVGIVANKKLLVVTAKDPENVKRSARNVTNVSLTAATRLNAYDVLKHKQLLLTKDAIEEMKSHFLAKEK